MLKKRDSEIQDNWKLFSDHLLAAVESTFVKLCKYYSLTNKTRLYRTAIALHPALRL